jgi:hypothetical protein
MSHAQPRVGVGEVGRQGGRERETGDDGRGHCHHHRIRPFGVRSHAHDQPVVVALDRIDGVPGAHIWQRPDHRGGERSVACRNPEVALCMVRERPLALERREGHLMQIVRAGAREPRHHDRTCIVGALDPFEEPAHRHGRHVVGRQQRGGVVRGLEETVLLIERRSPRSPRLPAPVRRHRLREGHLEPRGHLLHHRVVLLDPLRTELDDGAVREGHGPHPPADALARLEHRDVDPGIGDCRGRRQSGEPRANHDDPSLRMHQ